MAWEDNRVLCRIALMLSLGGLLVLAVTIVFTVLTHESMRTGTAPPPPTWLSVMFFYPLQLSGLVLGILAWRQSLGKAAAILSGVLLALSVLAIA